MLMHTACCVLVLATGVCAQKPGSFALPQARPQAPKPVISDDLASYFQLAPGQQQLVDIFDTGVVPEANFETQSEAYYRQQLVNQRQQQQQKLLQGGAFGFAPGVQIKQQPTTQFGKLPEGVDPQAIANAFGQQETPGSVQVLDVPRASNSGSSIRGIPNVQMHLPKPPKQSVQPAVQQSNGIQLPTIIERPQVPQGGLGPLSASASIDNEPKTGVFQPQFASNANFDTQVSQYGETGQNGGLLGAIMETFRQSAIAKSNTTQQQAAQDPAAYGKQQTQMLDAFRTALRNNAGSGQGGLLSNVLYNALTAGSLAQESNSTDPDEIKNRTTEAITENIGLIQQILTQNESPLCYPKPQPVRNFDVDAFMGTWYQVLYSPPVSAGPCSMISYNKLADVSSGGPGTVFDTFEYTTEATALGSPKIASGYAIVRAPGELIYRTSASDHDVSVNVVGVGPINALGQYEWALLVINCNYPVHVFARDPAVYKQRYESQVNSLLDQTGITTAFSRMLNLVAPVDTTLCSFPPTLFNIQG